MRPGVGWGRGALRRHEMLSTLCCTTLFQLAAAQAGGGGSFGGGGGGGGGGGDDGWIFEILYFLVRLAIEVPVVGVPLLIGVIVVGLLGLRRGWWQHEERVIGRQRSHRDLARQASALAALREHDPALDEARLLGRVRTAFTKAQSAWCAQDLEPLRPFVSDGVFERFSLQIEEQREHGWRQRLDGLRLAAATVQHVQLGRHFETLTVRIAFHAEVLRVRLSDGSVLPDSRLPREFFEECWSFVRRRGARTRDGAGLIEGCCPNCAAPLALNQSAQCAHCQCLMRSGEFDWVLTEITQASEWSPENELSIPGFALLAQRDPGFSAQALEDRASVAFWRWNAAARKRSVEPLLRVADAELCERESAALAGDADRTLYVERAVGSVRTLALQADAQGECALVEVVWDGRALRERPGSKGGELAPRRTLARTVFVFRRPAGATTRLEHALTTTHCRECGAHDTGGTAALCPYCSAPRSGDSSDWLLHEIVAVGSARWNELRNAPLPPASAARPAPSPDALLHWAIAAVRADGGIDAREDRALAALAQRLGVPAARVDQWLASAPVPPREATDLAEARAWYTELCALALADGTLARSERRFLRLAGAKLGLPGPESEALLRKVRHELYVASRRARRSTTGG